jgi:hypothetical protein
MHLLMILIPILTLRQAVTQQFQVLWQSYRRQQLHLIISRLLINFLLLLHSLSSGRILA